MSASDPKQTLEPTMIRVERYCFADLVFAVTLGVTSTPGSPLQVFMEPPGTVLLYDLPWRLSLYRKSTIHGKAERMCPGGSFGSVFGAVSSSVQAAADRQAKLNVHWIEEVIHEGVEKGQFTIGEQRPHDVAMQIFAGVQGALLSGRVTSDPYFLEVVAGQFRRYLGYGPRTRVGTSTAGAVA